MMDRCQNRKRSGAGTIDEVHPPISPRETIFKELGQAAAPAMSPIEGQPTIQPKIIQRLGRLQAAFLIQDLDGARPLRLQILANVQEIHSLRKKIP
jgi:hypothetical protein